MEKIKFAKNISNIIYLIGVAITLTLVIVFFFGSDEAVYPNNMMPYSWKETAFICLALGSIPMLLACMAVYKFNEIKNNIHKKRNCILIFFPCFICGACALYILRLIIIFFINFFMMYWAK